MRLHPRLKSLLRSVLGPLKRAALRAADRIRARYFPVAHLARQLSADGHGRVRIEMTDGHYQLIELIKTPAGPLIRLGWKGLEPYRFAYLRYRMPLFIHLLMRTGPGVTRLRANVSDHYDGSDASVLTSCSARPGAWLVPDTDFFHAKGYAALRALHAHTRPWAARRTTVLWRGATTGHGRFPVDADDVAHADVLPRIRLCALLRGEGDVDAKISKVVQTDDPERVTGVLTAAGLMGANLPPDTWADYQFAIDIDGNSNAWANLFGRLLLGCCVIKVQSPANFRQWYYDALEPWRHYVPVTADMSDLIEQIAWCRAHGSECEAIARRGAQLAHAMTLEGEIGKTVALLNARFGEVPDSAR
jgi:hypothetical protein